MAKVLAGANSVDGNQVELFSTAPPFGSGHGTYYPSRSSLAAERFHPLHTGQGLGLYMSASALGMFAGPPIWGAIADRTSFSLMFLLAGSAISVGTVVFVAGQSRARHLSSLTAGEASPGDQ